MLVFQTLNSEKRWCRIGWVPVQRLARLHVSCVEHTPQTTRALQAQWNGCDQQCSSSGGGEGPSHKIQIPLVSSKAELSVPASHKSDHPQKTLRELRNPLPTASP